MTMATVKAPTLAASVNRFIVVARATLPGRPPQVDFRTAFHARSAVRHALMAMLACSLAACAPRVAEHPSVAQAHGRPPSRRDRSSMAAKDAGDVVWQSATGSPARGEGRDRL